MTFAWAGSPPGHQPLATSHQLPARGFPGLDSSHQASVACGMLAPYTENFNIAFGRILSKNKFLGGKKNSLNHLEQMVHNIESVYRQSILSIQYNGEQSDFWLMSQLPLSCNKRN